MYLRYLPQFEYFSPKSVKEACTLLDKYQGKASVMAGGTDLLVCMKQGTMSPRYVIGLKSLPDLDHIKYREGESLRIGALVSHQVIADHPIIRKKFRVLQTACSKIGTPQIRNMGTIGGNLCNAAPSADSAPPLIVLGAMVKLVSTKGERIIPLEEYFVGPGQTVLSSGEILSEIQVPSPPPHTGVVYLKLPARTAVDIAAVGVAVLITLDAENSTCTDAKIALGAVAPTPIRAKCAEEMLRDRRIEDGLIQEAAQLASEEASPISDIRSSADYRRDMLKVFTEDAIGWALEQAKSTYPKV